MLLDSFIRTTNYSPQESLKSEQGFVLMWTLFVILPLLFVGYCFLSYANLTSIKIRSQFHTNNAVIFGARSAEFDTNDALNAMAADLHASTVAIMPKPDETWQDYDDYSVALDHQVNEGSNTITALLWREVNPIDSIIAQLGNVDVATISQATPEPNFISFVIDYSLSLRDGNMSDILEGFEVTNSGGGVGPNGIDLGGGNIVPNNAAQLALPASMSSRIRHDWARVGAAFPYPVLAVPNCTSQGENWCGGGPAPHQVGLVVKYSNLFTSYKKAALILLGVVAQMTPYIDVELLGGPLPGWVATFADSLQYGTPPGNDPSPYLPWQNDGVHTAWAFDEISADTYVFDNNLNPPLRPTVTEYHSFANPKNIFEDNVLMDFSRPYIIQAKWTKARKHLLYHSFTGLDGSFIAAGTYSHLLTPPLPQLTNPLWNPPPSDSVPLDYGSLILDGRLENELQAFYGMPDHPTPWLSLPAGAYTKSANLPAPYFNGTFYTCDTTGYGIYNNGPLEQGDDDEKHRAGYPRCISADWCDDGALNDSATCNSDNGSMDPDYLNVMNNPNHDISPGCPVGFKPRCATFSGKIVMDNAAFCLHSDNIGNPTPRCVPNPYVGVATCIADALADDPLTVVDLATAPAVTCNTNLNGHHTCTAADINAGTCTVGSAKRPINGIPPNDLGTITAPAADAPLVGANLFFMLMDMGFMNTGTFTHNAIPNDRCDAVRLASNNPDFPCILILITDGRPTTSDHLGNSSIPDIPDLQNIITARVDDFVVNKGGKIFTWYLRHSTSFGIILEQLGTMYPTLTIQQQDIYDTYLDQTPVQQIPAASCADFNAIGGSIPDCDQVNASIPQHNNSETMITWFKNYMNSPPNKVWVDTDLQNAPTGPDITGSLSTFLLGVKQVVAAAKNEAKLSR